ncbi:helicase [Bacteroidia bacterium]|nr:helicase [Bacteroidia bacterium]
MDNPKNNQPQFFDNINNRVIDDLCKEVCKGSRVAIAAASFSIYAYKILCKELESISELRFIFTGEAFTKEKGDKVHREFFIPRLNRERSLYGTDFEIKLRNELTQQAIAKECAEWIRKKVSFKSNISGENMPPFMAVDNGEKMAYTPINNFTTVDLGEDRGNNAYSITTKLYAPQSQHFFDTFNAVWNNREQLADVTDVVLENITAAYKENSPELIYFVALYNIFSEFLDDINESILPNEKTGFKDSAIWKMLYNFQKDAVIGCISKLNKHGGCILADSVGLGKTFSALGAIKYFESTNKNVLVLCPKRLSDNWNTFKHNYKNNPVAGDRLRYDVLFHTDLGREHGESNGINLNLINWENYDLVVIDESHIFRNGERSTHRKDEDYENRYQKLMNRVIKRGVKTKVLMLSATPVNINFSDLENQLKIASEGDLDELGKNINTNNQIKKIFRDANKVFEIWSALPADSRTTPKLLDMLSFDFFELLDSVTIARSRKHIEKYYADSTIGKFPERQKPESYRPLLTDLPDVSYNTLYEYIDKMNLAVYNPLQFVHASKLGKYVGDLENLSGKSWANREKGRNILMIINLLKRAESSIHSFRLSVTRISDFIKAQIAAIDNFEQGRKDTTVESFNDDFDSDDENDDVQDLQVGRKFKIDLADMDYVSWKAKLEEDKIVFAELLQCIEPITPEHDLKLLQLRELIREKIANPLNDNNKKLLIFTAFAETAEYLYKNLSDILLTHSLHSALVTGNGTSVTLRDLPKDFNTILTCFSPLAKNRHLLFDKNPGDIDILFATDCISEGQNLQDCDFLVNYDIHWNPVRIIQRFGRIDRIGSKNDKIQLVNFWPDISLDAYIKLKARVENRMSIVAVTAAGDNTLDNTDTNLEYRKRQLERLQEEVVDIEEMNEGVNIMDLGLNEFHLDLQQLLKKYGDADKLPFGIHAITSTGSTTAVTRSLSEVEMPVGVVFVLKNRNNAVNIDKQNRLHPFSLVYLRSDGEVYINHLAPKNLLDCLRLLCKGNDKPDKRLVKEFNRQTNDGKQMSYYSDLLATAVRSIINVKEERDVDSLFHSGGTTSLTNEVRGLDDFELINFLVIR